MVAVLSCLLCFNNFVLTMHDSTIALCPKINTSIYLNSRNAVYLYDLFYYYLSSVNLSFPKCVVSFKSPTQHFEEVALHDKIYNMSIALSFGFSS